jgi:ribosome-associated heat shock protein Hsp15
MLSITGLTLEQFADLMGGLGYKADRGERPKVKSSARACSPEPAATDAPETSTKRPGRCPAHGPGRGRHARSDPAGDPGGAAVEAPDLPPQETPADVPSEHRRRPRPRRCRATSPPETYPPRSRRPPSRRLEVFYTFTWEPKRRGGDRPQRRAEGGGGKPRGQKPKAAASRARAARGAGRAARTVRKARAPSRPDRQTRQGRSRQSLRGAGRTQGQVLSEQRPTDRLDRWLWHARFFKTRSLAARIVSGGGVRVNGTRATKPATGSIGPGDVLTFAQARSIRVIRILPSARGAGPRPRRRRFTTISTHRAPIPEVDSTARVGPRPTKKARRDMERPARSRC